MNNHPHPNAAKVFINWYLSREGQIAFRMANNTKEDETTTSMREDLPANVVPEAARRRKDVDYIEISRHDWMEWKPVGDLIKRLGRNPASDGSFEFGFSIADLSAKLRTGFRLGDKRHSKRLPDSKIEKSKIGGESIW